MVKDELKDLVSAAFTDCKVEVEGEGSHYALYIVSDDFTGLSEVKRQQKVYAVIKDYIASGAVHAVQIRALSPDQASPQS